jgi:L-fucose dehydrogenase
VYLQLKEKVILVTGGAKGIGPAITRREWAVELLLLYQIWVNTVVPAEVATPLCQQWLSKFPDPDQKLASITAKSPLGKE